ncbi:MAG TPA: hypothetical protein VFX37_10500 [Pseudolabrys sp.]|nr:hypothetical protein [Pseudolabrys sp.]
MVDNAPLSMPTQAEPVVGPGGLITLQWWRLLFGLFTRSNNASILTTAGDQELIGGFTEEEFDNGTPANGATITIDPSVNLKQLVTNNVAAFTIQATAESGDVELRIVNGATPGTITFSGFHFNFPGGDPLDTVPGNQFIVFIFGRGSAGADYIVRARQ